MSEPATILGVKVGTAAAIGAGASVAGLMVQGPWHVRLVAGASGALCSFFVTPILTPIATRVWGLLYSSLGIPVEHLSGDSVAGFVGFAAGLTGIDICRWIIERTKVGLKLFRWPFSWPPKPPTSGGQ